MRKRSNQLISEDIKRQAKSWTLTSNGGIDADEYMKSFDDELSEGKMSSAFLHPSQWTQLKSHASCMHQRYWYQGFDRVRES